MLNFLVTFLSNLLYSVTFFDWCSHIKTQTFTYITFAILQFFICFYLQKHRISLDRSHTNKMELVQCESDHEDTVRFLVPSSSLQFGK